MHKVFSYTVLEKECSSFFKINLENFNYNNLL